MIVECSSSSQAKSEPRKEALAGVVWVSQEFLRGLVERSIHSCIRSFIQSESLPSGLGRGAFIKFPRLVGFHGLPFSYTYRTLCEPLLMVAASTQVLRTMVWLGPSSQRMRAKKSTQVDASRTHSVPMLRGPVQPSQSEQGRIAQGWSLPRYHESAGPLTTPSDS